MSSLQKPTLKVFSHFRVVALKGCSLSPRAPLRLGEYMRNLLLFQLRSPFYVFVIILHPWAKEKVSKSDRLHYPPTWWSWVFAVSRGYFWPLERVSVRTGHWAWKAGAWVPVTLSLHACARERFLHHTASQDLCSKFPELLRISSRSAIAHALT